MARRQTIRVKHCHPRDWPGGWYIQVRGALDWEAIRELRFVRERDAHLALLALVAAGLNTKRRIQQAEQQAVCVAFEALQW